MQLARPLTRPYHILLPAFEAPAWHSAVAVPAVRVSCSCSRPTMPVQAQQPHQDHTTRVLQPAHDLPEVCTYKAGDAELGPPCPGLRKGWLIHRAAKTRATGLLIEQLQQLFPDLYQSDTGAKRACRRNEVFVDGAPGSTTCTVAEGQWIQLSVRAAAPAHAHTGVQATGPSLDICYEDDHIAVICKPAGLPTQGSGPGSVQGRIKYCLTRCGIPGALKHPVHAHRLDAATTGLVLVCKTRLALTRMSDAFQARLVKKRYVAVVKGRVDPPAGLIDCPLGGKPCLTQYEVLQVTPSATYGWLSSLSLRPHTGRKHQLRRHCAEVLCAGILGDSRHASSLSGAKRHYVRAVGQGGSSAQACLAAGPGSVQDAQLHVCADLGKEGGQAGRYVGDPGGRQSGHGMDGGADDGGADSDDADDVLGQDDEDEQGADSGVYSGSDTPGQASKRPKDCLADGTLALLCLCAVELEFEHPDTGQPLVVAIPEPDFFADYRRCEEAKQQQLQ